MKSYHWLILALGVALVAVSIRLAFALNTTSDSSSDTTDGTSGASALECIMTRASVRQYTTQEVPDSIIEKILRAGMAAPTAANKQPWEMVVITDQMLKDTIAASFPYSKMVKDAPFSVVVCGNTNRLLDGEGHDYWVQDCSAASENMLLAAHALGLGGVWCGVYPQTDRVKTMEALLALPGTLIPLNVMAFGYPSGPVVPKDKWVPARVHYNSWK